TLAGSVSSGSGNSSTSRASLSDTSRFARTAGRQASSTGSASALDTALMYSSRGSAAILLPLGFLNEPATADAGSPSAVPLYRHPADRRARARTNLARRFAPHASR